MRKKFLLFLFVSSVFIFESPTAFCYTSTTTSQSEQDWQKNVDQIIASCAQQKKRDSICDSVVIMKQIGNDSVEFVKEYMNLTPLGYATLTIVNFAASGRLRMRTSSPLFKKAQHVYDYHSAKEEVWFWIEKSY